MTPFVAHRPGTLEQAVSLLSENEDAKLLAGGHSLIPVMKQGLATPSALVDLDLIAELKGISLTPKGVRIAAMTRHAQVAASDMVSGAIPALAALAGRIGDPHVRHRGTLGGSVATNDPNADYPAAVLALDAIVETTARTIAAQDYFCGMYTTALEPDEIIVGIEFPRPDWACYEKACHPASGFAMVGVFVARFGGEVRVSITGAGVDGVFRHAGLETALVAEFSPESIDDVEIDADDMASDFHASQAYRANLVKVLTRRCVARCLSETPRD